MRKRCCYVWPIDAKRALGYVGTVQDVWLQPTGLIPTDVPRELATPIRFTANKACGNMPVISAMLLKPGHKYEVEFTDRREAALNGLDAETRQTIEARRARALRASRSGERVVIVSLSRFRMRLRTLI